MSDPKTVAEVIGGLERKIAEVKADADKTAAEQREALERMTVQLSAALEAQSRAAVVAPPTPVEPGAGGSMLEAAYRMAGGQIQLHGVTAQRDSHGGTYFAERTVEVEVAGGKLPVTRHGLLDDPEPMTQWQVDLQRAVTDRAVLRAMGVRSTPRKDGEIVKLAIRAPTAALRDALVQGIRSMSDTTGAGAEWVPDGYVPSLYEFYQLPGNILSNVPEFPISGPTILPRIDTGLRPYLTAAVTTDDPAMYTASSSTSSSQTISPQGLAVRAVLDEMLLEDSAIPVLDVMRRAAARALIDAAEDCWVNGDTTASHQDALSAWNTRSRWGASGLGSTADHRRGWLGWRAESADNSTTSNQTAAQTPASLLTLANLLGTRSVARLVCFVSPEVYVQKWVGDSSVATVDKLGPAATILTGQLASAYGIPIIVSPWVTADLETTGLYTDGSGAKSGVVLVAMDEYATATRRGASVQLVAEPQRGAVHLVGKWRGVGVKYPSSSTKTAAFGINYL